MDATALKALSRAELQKLARAHKIKANLRSAIIIELLLERHAGSVPLTPRATPNRRERSQNPSPAELPRNAAPLPETPIYPAIPSIPNNAPPKRPWRQVRGVEPWVGPGPTNVAYWQPGWPASHESRSYLRNRGVARSPGGDTVLGDSLCSNASSSNHSVDQGQKCRRKCGTRYGTARTASFRRPDSQSSNCPGRNCDGQNNMPPRPLPDAGGNTILSTPGAGPSRYEVENDENIPPLSHHAAAPPNAAEPAEANRPPHGATAFLDDLVARGIENVYEEGLAQAAAEPDSSDDGSFHSYQSEGEMTPEPAELRRIIRAVRSIRSISQWQRERYRSSAALRELADGLREETKKLREQVAQEAAMRRRVQAYLQHWQKVVPYWTDAELYDRPYRTFIDEDGYVDELDSDEGSDALEPVSDVENDSPLDEPEPAYELTLQQTERRKMPNRNPLAEIIPRAVGRPDSGEQINENGKRPRSPAHEEPEEIVNKRGKTAHNSNGDGSDGESAPKFDKGKKVDKGKGRMKTPGASGSEEGGSLRRSKRTRSRSHTTDGTDIAQVDKGKGRMMSPVAEDDEEDYEDSMNVDAMLSIIQSDESVDAVKDPNPAPPQPQRVVSPEPPREPVSPPARPLRRSSRQASNPLPPPRPKYSARNGKRRRI